MKMTKINQWVKDLKPGALAGLVFGNNWYPVVFGEWKSYQYKNSGILYYDLYWYDQHKDGRAMIPDWIQERSEEVLTKVKKPYGCYILTSADKRLFPLSETMLTPSQKYLYNAYKKRFNYEY
jgi:hypothetical protein